MSSATGRFLGLTLLALATVAAIARAAVPAGTDAGPASSAPAQSKDAAHMESFAKPNGDSYFALSLVPQTALSPAESSEVVILFDTSASQLGAYRETGLEVLNGLLATLGDKDRVKLVAIDVDAVPLTDSFVSRAAPKSPLHSKNFNAASRSARPISKPPSTAR